MWPYSGTHKKIKGVSLSLCGFYWTKGGKYFDNGVSINIPVIRYAEVILNRAEALAEDNKLTEAWTQLERIRDRAGLSMIGVSNSDKMALLMQIKNDRRIELLY
jgi:diketogulonate reductase-like aldo/keto reductase